MNLCTSCFISFLVVSFLLEVRFLYVPKLLCKSKKKKGENNEGCPQYQGLFVFFLHFSIFINNCKNVYLFLFNLHLVIPNISKGNSENNVPLDSQPLHYKLGHRIVLTKCHLVSHFIQILIFNPCDGPIRINKSQLNLQPKSSIMESVPILLILNLHNLYFKRGC